MEYKLNKIYVWKIIRVVEIIDESYVQMLMYWGKRSFESNSRTRNINTPKMKIPMYLLFYQELKKEVEKMRQMGIKENFD